MAEQQSPDPTATGSAPRPAVAGLHVASMIDAVEEHSREERVESILRRGDRRDQGAERRDRAAEARGQTDSEAMSAIDRDWAARDRDQAAADRADLLQVLREHDVQSPDV